MKRNVGGMEMALRLVIGIALLALGFLHVISGSLAIAAYVVGGIAILTGVIRYCPAWSIFGINTASAAHK
jgi:hypothetical protein